MLSVAGCAVFLAADGAAAGNQVVLPASRCPHIPIFRRPGVKLLGWGQCFCFGVVFHFLPEPQAGLRANLLGRSRAAGPRLNLWLYSFAKCDAVAVAALRIANRTCLRTAVLVGLMIRGFLIFGWDDAA